MVDENAAKFTALTDVVERPTLNNKSKCRGLVIKNESIISIIPIGIG